MLLHPAWRQPQIKPGFFKHPGVDYISDLLVSPPAKEDLMADVFISYASADREQAQAIAASLANRGYKVWWDRTIPPGRIFDEVIQEALNAARCVIVLWSKTSIGSNWVKTEAAEAGSRNILVPVLIANVPPPIEFRRLQAANLAGWNGDEDSLEFNNLLASIDRLVHSGTPPVAGKLPAADAVWNKPRRPRLMAGSLAALLLVAATGGYWFHQNRTAAETPPPTRDTRAAAQNDTPPSPSLPSSASREAPPEAVLPSAAMPAIPPKAPPKGESKTQINLLAQNNGGQLIVANSDLWLKTIDGDEKNWEYAIGEAVFNFKDDRPATFDTFTVLIPSTDGLNLKEFELLFGNDSPTGHFESIGKFQTQNLKLFRSPYQVFTFSPVTAKYLKVRSLANHAGGKDGIIVYEFQLFGTLK